MNRKPFYEVPRAAWLFVQPGGKENEHEEPVRQWCIHELLRAYGVCITDLKTEAKAKVGSKEYRIDILIERAGEPWIVVECKRAEFRQHEKAVEQAISYAASLRINAEYVLYTNGDEWRVSRRLQRGWVSVVDLPCINAGEASQDFADHIRALGTMKPILRLLDTEAKGADAAMLLQAMQVMFNCSLSWCWSVNKRLLVAADNLLRAVAHPDQHIKYRVGKLATAADNLKSFAISRGTNAESWPDCRDDDIKTELQYLSAVWQNSFAASNGIDAADVPVVNLIAVIIEYGRDLPPSVRKYPALTPSFHSRLREFLDSALKVHFGLNLPEAGDDFLMRDLRDACEEDAFSPK